MLLSVGISIYIYYYLLHFSIRTKNQGPLRELNPWPPAPEAGIIPLDQAATIITHIIKL